MVKVKICGITRQEDVFYVNKHKPDYVGFVFADSRRRVSPEQCAKLAYALNGNIKKVGVFVNENPAVIVKIIDQCKLDVVQVHGDETVEYMLELSRLIPFGIEVWKAVRVRDMFSLLELEKFKVDAYVLDAYDEAGYGGTGKIIDWNLVSSVGKLGKVILAGGLTPENVHDAVSIVRPYAVDVSSGVETGGYKDEKKIRDFIYSACHT